MSIKDNLLQKGVKQTSEILGPFLTSFDDPELDKSIWEAHDVVIENVDPRPAKPTEGTLGRIQAYHEAADPDLFAFYNALDDVKTVIDAVRDVAEAYEAASGVGVIDELQRQVLGGLTLNYLRINDPTLFHVLKLFRFVQGKLDDCYHDQLFVERLFAFLEDTGGFLSDTWGSLVDLETVDDARQLGDAVFLPVAAALGYLLGDKAFAANYRWQAQPDSATPGTDAIADHTLAVQIGGIDVLGEDGEPHAQGELALQLAATFVPREHGGPGLLLSLGGKPSFDIPITLPIDNDAAASDNGSGTSETDENDGSRWNLHVELDAPALGAAFLRFNGRKGDFDTPASAGAFDLRATFEPIGDFDNRILGSSKGTRLEIGKPKVSLRIRKLPDNDDFLLDFKVQTKGTKLVISPGEGDSFVRGVLPKGDLELDIDLGLGVRKSEGGSLGPYLEGGDSLEVTFPGGAKLGPAELRELSSKLKPSSGKDGVGSTTQGLSAPGGAAGASPDAERDPRTGFTFETSAALSVQIGPLKATLDRVGMTVHVREDERGNLGPLDVGLGFKPPSGIGIAIDSGAVSGGGYLLFDPDNARYAGVVQLKLEKLRLNAVGLLTTRMPDGSDGYSLVLIIAADDFPAINLGLGFKLTGIGGMLGYNRGVAVDVLRAGLKSRSLDPILYPADPVRNAPSIVSGISRAFPGRRGQHFVGPVAEIAWGTDDLLTAQLGVVLEFPDPLRVVMLGQIRGQFPSKKKALVDLKMDLLGAIDFDRGESMAVATLFDSKLLGASVSGDAAFFARWERDPTFILSAGGFHPSYPAPSELPALDRLTLSLSKGDKVKLLLTWYMALTSNTLQHGARVDATLRASSFRIDGHLGYDTLVQFDPFAFQIEFSAGVGLKWRSHTLASVLLEGSLAGPSPWHVAGKAKFKIWRFSKSVSFDKTLGRKETLPPIPVTDPTPLLLDALKAESSWSAATPAREDMVVMLRDEPSTGAVRVHPLGRIAVRQQVVPLDMRITKFGNARLAGSKLYHVDRVEMANESGLFEQRAHTFQEEHFATGQFQELDQRERLSRPSFESQRAGVAVDTQALRFAEAAHRRDVTVGYETRLLLDDEESGDAPTTVDTTFEPSAASIERQIRHGAAARSPARGSGLDRFAPRAKRAVAQPDNGFVVAGREDLARVTDHDGEAGAVLTTHSAAFEALEDYVQRHPDKRGALQVVPSREMQEVPA